ncbi:TPR domain protein [hydrothermal vent metagenome]|uniref:TPR domain protein n=1 Tax=hydrothermal vent metagenome TaxID=652676 RepID=A0A3B0WTR0_9ZZZZ
MSDKNQIRTFVQNGQMSEAKTLCVKICEQNPDDVESWFLHGMLDGLRKDFSNAKICYDNVIRLMPAMAAAYYNQGIALQELGNYKEALTAFNKVAELEPDFQNINLMIADACFSLASIFQSQKNLDEAESLYEKAIESRPDYHQAYNNLGLLHKDNKNYEIAANFFSKAVELKPDYVDARSNLGHAHEMLKNYRDALTAYQKICGLIPDSAEAQYSAGLQHESLGQFSEAKKCFSLARSLDPKSNRYPMVLARVFAAEKNYDEAITHYEEAIDKDPAFADTYYFLGRVYMDINNKEAAINHFRKTYELSPDHVSVNYYLAELDPDSNKSEAQTRYVAELFDNYADTFENDLVNNLQYKTPAVIHRQVMPHLGDSRDLVIFDLGCGTGLCGELFRDVASRLVGVDLSPKIVEKAREKSVYDELQVDELTTSLQKESASVDVILAADVYVYIGDLKPIFDAAVSALKPSGLYSFSVEHSDGDLYELQSSGRYSHSVSYIEGLAASAGLYVLSHATSVLRKELGADVEGDVYVFARSAE